LRVGRRERGREGGVGQMSCLPAERTVPSLVAGSWEGGREEGRKGGEGEMVKYVYARILTHHPPSLPPSLLTLPGSSQSVPVAAAAGAAAAVVVWRPWWRR